MPETDKNEYRPTQKPNWVEIWTLAISTVGLIVVTFYACQAYRQRAAMDTTNDLAIEAERPWAGIGNVMIIEKPTPNNPIKISATIINGGKSPAIYMTIFHVFKLWATTRTDGSIPLHTEIDACTKPKPEWKHDLNGFVLIPGVVRYIEGASPPITPVMFNFWLNKKSIGDPADAGEVVFGIKPKPVEPWMIGLFFVGCMNYFDQKHRPHQTSWCYYYDPFKAVLYGSFGLCDKGNTAD